MNEPMEKRGVIAPGWTPAPAPDAGSEAPAGEKQAVDRLEEHLTKRLADAARTDLAAS